MGERDQVEKQREPETAVHWHKKAGGGGRSIETTLYLCDALDVRDLHLQVADRDQQPALAAQALHLREIRVREGGAFK